MQTHYLLDGVLRGKAVRSRFPEVYDGVTWRSTDIAAYDAYLFYAKG